VLSILNNIASLTAESSLAQTQANLQKTLTQLSTGLRINSGSDDAAGLSIANGLQANILALTQSNQNAANGIGLLQTADGALSQVTTLLNRAVTLATEASTSGLTSDQSSALNTEFQSILSEIDQIGSSTNFNGLGVFTGMAGTSTDLTASAFSGGNGGDSSSIVFGGGGSTPIVFTGGGADTPLTFSVGDVNNTLSDVPIDITSAGGTHGASVTLSGYNGLASSSQATETATAATLQTYLDTKLEPHTGSTYTVTDTLGNVSISSSNAAESLTVTDKTNPLGEPYLVSPSTATLTLGDPLSGTLTFTSNSPGDGLASQTINLASYSGLDSTSQATETAAANSLASALDENLGGAESTSYTVDDTNGALWIETNGYDAMSVTSNASEGTVAKPLTFSLTQGDTLSGSITISSTGGTGPGSQTIDMSSFAGLASSSQATETAAAASLTTALNTTLGAETGSTYAVSDTAGAVSVTTSGGGSATEVYSVTASSLVETAPGVAGAGGNVFTSDGTSGGSTELNTQIAALSSGVLGIGSDTLGSTSAATTALSHVTAAVNTVSASRGSIGASINRLTADTSLMTEEVQNLTSAQNNLQNADIGQTVANMTQYNVLQSTGMAALQQANKSQQAVLNLLQ
jgi:flagellin